MDNFTHSLAGWALGQAGLKTKTRKGLAALILGANAPDIDVVTGWVPWVPLATHRGFTHGLLGGVLILPLLVAGLLDALDRWQVARGVHFKSGLAMDRRWLLGLAAIGVLTHPLLDVLTSYSVQLLSPWATDWYRAEALFIIDPMLWLLLPAGIAWSRRREKEGQAWHRVAQATVGLALAYVAANLALTRAAKIATLAQAPAARDLVASPAPGRPWRRQMAWREDRGGARGYRAASWSPATGLRIAPGWTAAGIDDARVIDALRRAPELRRYVRWSILPVAEVREQGCARTVMLRDARYLDARARLSAEAVVPIC